jgi:VWFA-related protein
MFTLNLAGVFTVNRWLVVLLLSCAWHGFAQTPESDKPVRVSTELVIVDTQATRQSDGKLVGGLKPEDFVLTENGVAQNIELFSQDKLALSVVLLFDLTDTSQPVLKRLAQGALQAIQHLKAEDELAVMAYSNQTLLLQGFTRDRDQAVAAIEKAATMDAPEQLALFNEAVWRTADYLQANAQPRTRRVILWLSDNLPNRPPQTAHTEKEAMDQLFENDIAVFGVMMQTTEGKFINFFGRPKGSGDMFRYAAQTGGEIIKAETEHVSQRVADIIERMRARYALGYISSNTGKGFRRIRVELTAAVMKREGKVLLRGKAGYFAK